MTGTPLASPGILTTLLSTRLWPIPLPAPTLSPHTDDSWRTGSCPQKGIKKPLTLLNLSIPTSPQGSLGKTLSPNACGV